MLLLCMLLLLKLEIHDLEVICVKISQCLMLCLINQILKCSCNIILADVCCKRNRLELHPSFITSQGCLSVLSWNYNVLIIRRARKFFSMPIDSYLSCVQPNSQPRSIINHILYISSNIYPTLLSCCNLLGWNMYILYIN